MNRQPAVLGNRPFFGSRINIVRPTLPDYDELAEELRSIFQSGNLTKGKHVRAFENALTEQLGVRHAVAVSSCTTGLMLTYQALELSGDVVVPSFTFMATVSALRWVGVRPVFADVHPGTANLDADAAEAALTPKTSAIVAVHNHGNPADVDELQAVADRHGLQLIFDAAHAFGSQYQGTAIGPKGIANIFSLSPTKLLVAGEGGIVATNDDRLAAKIRIGREYGNDGNYDSVFPGLNGRLPEVNALLGRHNLHRLESGAVHRNLLAKLYRDELGQVPGIGFQEVLPGNRSSYKDFFVIVDADAFGLSRDELALVLDAENIETRKYYCPPVHLQTAYREFAPPVGRLSATEFLSARSLTLPIWSHMETSMVSGISSVIRMAHDFAPEIKVALRQEERGLVGVAD
jgi:dTDP-4-amino-4,6-dideoxygalactose transaminase